MVIRRFIKFDSIGKYQILLRNTSIDTAQYFAGQAPASILQPLSAAFIGHNYDSLYEYNPAGNYLYCGLSYVIEYSTKGKRSLIKFIPPETPKSIQSTSDMLDSFCLRGNLSPANFIKLKDFDSVAKGLGLDYLKIPFPKMVKPPKIDLSKFAPPKISRD